MKRMIYLVLVLLFVLSLCSCADEPISDDMSESTVHEAGEMLFPDAEYTAVDEKFVMGNWLGVTPDAIGLNEDSVFVNDEQMVSYDYVTLFGVKGNISFYLQNGKVLYYVFGSTPYTEKATFSADLENMSKKTAELLGTEKHELVFNGGEEGHDEWEQLFEGNGVFATEYKGANHAVTVKGCGVSDVATIVAECHAKNEVTGR